MKPSLRTRFLAFDAALARQGVPPLTPWWREGIGRWLDAYERGHVLELWACCGRGAAKSTALYKLATFFTLFGDFVVPPGERHLAVVLSRLKEEAAKGIDIIAAWLRLLGVAHHVSGDVIELGEMPRGIRVVAASVAGASGWRAYFVGKDERSKWPMGGAEGLDADEIDTSAAAMTATHPHTPVVSFGSAWGMFGTFYDAIVSGSDESKIVLGPAPTWVAAPHISEDSTRRKERDPRRWAREYKCEFQAGALGCFDPDDVAAAFEPRPAGEELGPRVVIIDPSSGARDTFTYGVCSFEGGGQVPRSAFEIDAADEGGEPAAEEPTDAPPRLRFWVVGGFAAEQARALGSVGVVNRIARVARAHNVRTAHADQREAFSLSSEFGHEGLGYVQHPWSAANKAPAIELVRRWLRERALILPEHETMRRELLAFEERLGPNGFTYGARGSGHDDYVALLVTAAMAALVGYLRGARLRRVSRTPGRRRRAQRFISPMRF